MKAFISGKISGDENYKQKFALAERQLKKLGYSVMNPSVLPLGFEYEDYIDICIKMISKCDTFVQLSDWAESEGAKREFEYAKNLSGMTVTGLNDLMYDLHAKTLKAMSVQFDADLAKYGDGLEDKVSALKWAVEMLC